MITLALRASTRRWTQLSALLRSFERCCEASARLDGAAQHRAYVTTRGVAPAARVDARLRTLERAIDREFDRLTAERLRQDLAWKIAHAARPA